MNSFFGSGFKGVKCKTALKLTIPRIKLLRNKREVQLKQMRKEIAQLLQAGQEMTARIRVEHIIREQNILAAYEIIELFCELIAVRLPIIESQRECPLDLKEALSSLCFAAPRCSDLPELLQVQSMLAAKYGKEFVAAAAELRPDCGVNRQIIEKLSVRAPSPEVKLNLLKEIAEEHDIEWDTSSTEAEFFKLHEDLLNGPSQFLSGTKMPLPEEKLQHQSSVQSRSENSVSDEGSDELDLPSVPTQAVAENSAVTNARNSADDMTESTHLHDTTQSFKTDSQVKNNSSPTASSSNGATRVQQFVPFFYTPPTVDPEKDVLNKVPPPSLANESTRGNPDSNYVEQKLHAEPSFPSGGIPADTNLQIPKVPSGTSPSMLPKEGRRELQDILEAAQTAAASADRAAAAARAAAELAKVRISEMIDGADSERYRADDTFSAAESADRAAAAACTAAEFAKVRISEMIDGADSESYRADNTSSANKDSVGKTGIPNINYSEQISQSDRRDDIFDLNLENDERTDSDLGPKSHGSGFVGKDGMPIDVTTGAMQHDQGTYHTSHTSGKNQHDDLAYGPPSVKEPSFDRESSLKMPRSDSLEDESYYSYPNLFGPRNSFDRTG